MGVESTNGDQDRPVYVPGDPYESLGDVLEDAARQQHFFLRGAFMRYNDLLMLPVLTVIAVVSKRLLARARRV